MRTLPSASTRTTSVNVPPASTAPIALTGHSSCNDIIPLFKPTLEQFADYAHSGDLVPVWKEFLFDADTAVTAFAKLARPPFAFLLESVVGGEKWARYTFLGTAPRSAWRLDAQGRTSMWHPDT